MAVPFVMPEEDDITHFIRFVLAVMKNHHENVGKNIKQLEEIEKKVLSSNHDNLRQALIAVCHKLEEYTGPSPARTLRIRTSSESSWCEDNKPNQQVDIRHDFNQESRGASSCAQDNNCSFWRIVTRPMRRLLYKASVPILCVMGWHLFQTTYQYM